MLTIELQKAFEQYQNIFENTPVATMLINSEGKIIEWNQSATDIFEWTPDETKNTSVTEIFLDDLNFHKLKECIIKSNEKFDRDISYIQKVHSKSKKEKTCEWRIVKVNSITDSTSDFLLIANDITEKVKLEQIISQTQKMDAIGKMAGGIAHDFNNILNVINGYTQVIQQEIKDNNAIAEPVRHILKSVEKAGALTRRLLLFSQNQKITPNEIEINSLIQDLANSILRPLVGSTISLKLELSPGLPLILADITQIEQVLMNLVGNARDALNEKYDQAPYKRQITIRTRKIETSLNHNGSQNVTDKNYILIEIDDNGIGMTKETLDKIYEPFFTTKEPNKGTGLGMVTVYSIVKQNDGLIEFTSERGVGTTFQIRWPVHKSESNDISDLLRNPNIDMGEEHKKFS